MDPAVQLVGGTEQQPQDHAEYIGRNVDLVTTLDPWVDHPYRFAAIWLTESAEQVETANRLLYRGIEHHPTQWRNYFYLGFNQFFYQGEHALAAETLENAARLDGAPKYLPRLVARLRSQSADLEAAVIFLVQLLEDTKDPERRATLQAGLDEVDVERKARMLERARSQYAQLHGRDITHVADLVAGPNPVLRALPPAEPVSIPDALRGRAQWELDRDGKIISSYYGRRYELHMHSADAEHRERLIREREAEARAQQAASAVEGNDV